MNKVFVLQPGENWICDRQVQEYIAHNIERAVYSHSQADIIWLMADWCWRKIPLTVLANKKVVTTIHHIVPEKFNNHAILDFIERDKITTAYIVPNIHTENFIKNYTQKPIHVIPYWANQYLWYKSNKSKEELRASFNIPNDVTVYGSFQRDSEGADTSKPKLEKGPDLLADFLISKNEQQKIHVVLAGWRRQYIMKRLKDAKVDFSYFELPNSVKLNLLYQTLDVYPVTARYEGGPQSFIECGLLEIPMISRSVGMAEQVLSKNAINDNILLAVPEIPKLSKDILFPEGFKKYNELFDTLC